MSLNAYDVILLPNLAALRAISKSGLTAIIVAGAVTQNDGGGGIYYIDKSDTTSADNGSTTIVTNAAERWKTTQMPGQVKHSDFQAPAVTGNFSVTGIGFKPKAIEIKTLVSSLLGVYESQGVFGTGLQRAYFSAIDVGGRAAGSVTNNIINVKDIAGLNTCFASVVSLDNDGFTLNFTSVSLRPFCLVTAYS